jgi:CCR4-NOT transcription complex subunit 1 CAF1-binding domain
MLTACTNSPVSHCMYQQSCVSLHVPTVPCLTACTNSPVSHCMYQQSRVWMVGLQLLVSCGLTVPMALQLSVLWMCIAILLSACCCRSRRRMQDPHTPCCGICLVQVQDKIAFLMNNLALSNMDAKVAELKTVLSDEYIPWFANYLVVKRAAQEPNFHSLYMTVRFCPGSPSSAALWEIQAISFLFALSPSFFFGSLF